jgi:hypothetical protein
LIFSGRLAAKMATTELGWKVYGTPATNQVGNKNMKRVLSIAAVFVAISLAGSQAFALDEVRAKKIKKAVRSATLPEMPAVVAQLVTQAAKADREAVALTAFQEAVYKNPSAAPMLVAAISKAAPDLSDVVTKKAIQLQPALSSSVIAADRTTTSGRDSVIAAGSGHGNSGNSGNSGQGGGVATGHFDPSNHNPGPPLPDAAPHHNRPPHPLGGPPGLIDYSKPRPHH